MRLSLHTNPLTTIGFGLAVSRKLFSVFGVDATWSYENLGYGHDGMAVETLARVLGGGRHAASLGIGPSLHWAKEFGQVAFCTGELAYEYRPVGGVSVLLGVGVDVALNNSGTATCPDSGWFSCLFWMDHYSQGDVLLRVRIAIGGSL